MRTYAEFEKEAPAEEEAFARAAREFLKVGEDDYNFTEYDSGLDHYDGCNLSDLARFFFEAGRKSK